MSLHAIFFFSGYVLELFAYLLLFSFFKERKLHINDVKNAGAFVQFIQINKIGFSSSNHWIVSFLSQHG